MFANIAGRYDLANDVLSGGIHRLWRKRLLRELPNVNSLRILDLCTGTGDLAFELERAAGPNGRVLALDFVHEMLVQAVRKRARRGSRVLFFQGDALFIPLCNSSVDVATVSFGIRNVDDVPACLREIRRVLGPSGTLIVLEFGQVRWPVFRSLYDWYGKHVMPLLGKLLTGNRSAYEYLPKTALRFPAGDEFLRLMEREGYESVRAVSLLGGLAYIYRGISSSSKGERTIPPMHASA